MGLNAEEEQLNDYFNSHNLLDIETNKQYLTYAYNTLERDYENRNFIFDKSQKIKRDVDFMLNNRIDKLSNLEINNLAFMYWQAMLLEARNKQLDSYLLYLEKNRLPKDKFYVPRSNCFNRIGLIQALQDMLDDKLDLLTISLPPGTGKAQPLYSNVLTPKGYVKMGDLKVGDKVIAADGTSAKVLGVFPQGVKDVYEICLVDGSKCQASGSHLFKVYSKKNGYAIKTLNFLLRGDFRKYYIPVYLKGKKPIYKQIKTITKVSDFECQCIYIDNPQHLYITDDGIITHNTTLEKFFLSGVIGWWPECSNLFYSHSGDITRMFYDGELDICTNAAEYTWSEIFRQQVTSTNAKMEQFNVGKYKPFQSVQCTSVGSNNAGKVRVSNKGYLLVDDLIGSIEQALNINILDKLWNSYSVDARQRMLDGAKEIIIATRWSVHDPIGRLQRLYENNNTGKRVRFIAVPDIDPETDESNFNFTVNGLSKEFFESQALVMDEISYKCLYKQKPVEREGLLYREDELRYYTDLPQQEPDAVIGVCDTKNTGSDYMVLPVFYRYGEDYYLVDCVCDNSTDFNVLYARMVDLIIEHNVQAIEFESNQGGRAITTTIRNMLAERNFICNITEKPTETNKEARIIANSYHVKQKILFKEKGLIPAKSDYATLMDQLKSYTQLGKNKHDDVPDCLANFILYTNRKVNRRQSHISKHIL